MIELLQCLLQNQNEKIAIVTSQNLNSLLLLLYILASLSSRKYFFISVFIISEVFGVFAIASGMHGNYEFMYYLSSASMYCLFYWAANAMKCNVKILLAYGIMVLFQSVMVVDAYNFQDTETAIYNSYEYVVLVIHLYIIITLIRWGTLRRTLGGIVNSIASFLNIGYACAFCYNAYILHNKKQT